MTVWTGTLDIAFRLTSEMIKKDSYLQEFFADPDNPTDDEVRKYFENRQMNYAESNDGSELLANADLTIEKEEVADK